MQVLLKNGVTSEQIIVADAGSYTWYPYSHLINEKLLSKEFHISFKKFANINSIFRDVEMEGVRSMDILQLKHKNINEYREEVKLAALRAAKTKAEKLLAVVDQEIGGVIYIIEGDEYNSNNNYNYPWYRGRGYFDGLGGSNDTIKFDSQNSGD